MNILCRLIIVLACSLFIISCNPDSSTEGTSVKTEKITNADVKSVEQKTDKSVQNNSREELRTDAKGGESFTKAPENLDANPVQELTQRNGKVENKNTQEKRAEQKAIVAKGGLPDACTLISKEQIATIINEDPSIVRLKNGTSPQSSNTQACFYRWDFNGMPNSGILVQVQTNPIPDDLPTWASSFVDSKKSVGETDYSGSGETIKYKTMTNLGNAGAYSFEMGKYFWRLNDDYVFMIAYNLPGTDEATQLKYTKKIGDIVTAVFK